VIGQEENGSASVDTAAIDAFLNGLKQSLENGDLRGKGSQS
jgi:hypothetical protein